MTETERLTRQIRNAVVFMAWVIVAGILLGMILFLRQIPSPNSPSYGSYDTPTSTAPLKLCEINPTYAC